MLCHNTDSKLLISTLVLLLCLSGFLTAVLQNHARKTKVSVDSLFFNFDVRPSPADTDESLTDVKVKLDIKELGFKVNYYFMER